MKRIFLYILATVFFLSISAIPTHAVLSGFSSNCLGADNHEAGILGFHDAAKLSIVEGKKPKPDVETFIFLCMKGPHSGDAPRCSTSKKELDILLFGTSEIHTDGEFGKMEYGNANPTTTNGDASGFVNDPVVWSVYTKYLQDHTFYWVQAENAEPINPIIPTPPPGDPLVGQGALQNTQLIFDKIMSAIGGEELAGACATIGWDPRGFVFDAETLHPIKNVVVTLSGKSTDGLFTDVPSGLGVTNPFTTADNRGSYSFFVSPGIYKMRISSPNAVIAEKGGVNTAAGQLFLDKNGNTNIYSTNQEVEEINGMVAVAHIPVTVTDKSLLITSLNILTTNTQVVINPTDHLSQIHISGAVSHPKSKMILNLTMVDEKGNNVEMNPVVKYTNDLGEYDEYINQDQVSTEGKILFLQAVNVRFELNPFYTTGSFSTVGSQANTSFSVKALPTYLEGIAYDAKGVPIPKAIVGVYPFYSNNPMYVVVADADGYYKMGTQHIPQLQYMLKYKKPSGEIVITDPAAFVKQNVKYFTEQGVNPFNTVITSPVEDSMEEVKMAQYVSRNDLQSMSKASVSFPSRGGGSIEIANTPIPQQGSGIQNISTIIVTMILVVLVGAGAVLVVQMKQKKSSW